jgi:hypothetical protein
MDADTPPRYIAESTPVKKDGFSTPNMKQSKIIDDDRNAVNENKTFVDNNAEKPEDPVMTFGDDLDVPAFIRNRRR